METLLAALAATVVVASVTWIKGRLRWLLANARLDEGE